MARRSQHTSPAFPKNFVDHCGEAGHGLPTTGQFGSVGYTSRTSPPSLDDIYRELDGAVVHQDSLSWQLRILGIHEAGAERWIQLTAASGPLEHDLVLHMNPGARTANVITSIEEWFDTPVLAGRIIDVP
jgi:hypothetical protein